MNNSKVLARARQEFRIRENEIRGHTLHRFQKHRLIYVC